MKQELILPICSSVKTVSGVTEPSTHGRSNTMFTVTRKYRNTLGYTVCIIDRNSIVVSLPPSVNSRGNSELIVEYRINVSDNVNLNWDTVLNEASSIPTIVALQTLAKTTGVKVSNMGSEFIVEYTITHAEFAKNNFNVYYDDLDIVIVKTEHAHTTVHPYSIIGQDLVTSKDVNPAGFYYRIIINDPFGDFGERFINVNGSVFKVRRTVDKSVKSGVYVFSNDKCNEDSLYEIGRGDKYYTFDEADEKVSLYGTSHLAESLGDLHYKREQLIKGMESEAKHRLAELNIHKLDLETKLKNMEHRHKQEYMKLELENVRLKDELDREKMYRDQKQQREKYEYDSRSREDKDHYERRSYERKDTAEFLKWLPTILTAIMAVANLIVAAQKSKT